MQVEYALSTLGYLAAALFPGKAWPPDAPTEIYDISKQERDIEDAQKWRKQMLRDKALGDMSCTLPSEILLSPLAHASWHNEPQPLEPPPLAAEQTAREKETPSRCQRNHSDTTRTGGGNSSQRRSPRTIREYSICALVVERTAPRPYRREERASRSIAVVLGICCQTCSSA